MSDRPRHVAAEQEMGSHQKTAMRVAFLLVATAIVMDGTFLSGAVRANDTKEAPVPGRTVAESPSYAEPPGWSCDSSNRIFFDDCGQHRHHHHSVVAVGETFSEEARREPKSVLKSSPAPGKSAQISLNEEPATKPETKPNADRIRREHGRASQPRSARIGEPAPILLAGYGYYAYAPIRLRSGSL